MIEACSTPAEELLNLGGPVYFEATGCVPQRTELAIIKNGLRTVGIDDTDKICKARAVILTGCGVTAETSRDVAAIIDQIRNQTSAPIFLGGCAPRIDKFDGADGQVRIFNTKELLKLLVPLNPLSLNQGVPFVPFWINNLREKMETRDKLYELDPRLGLAYEYTTGGLYIANEPNTAKLLVSRGCNSKCTYCAVPLGRGKHQTTDHRTLIGGVRKAKASGFERMVLLGENLGQYGIDTIDKTKRVRFDELLDLFVSENPDIRMSILNLEPPDAVRFHETLIRLARKGNIYFLGIPVQSGSRAVLKRMRRYPNLEKLKNLFYRLKQIDGLHLGTMFINGFPGETEQDHRDSLELIRQIEFDIVNCNQFSCRPGTKAAGYDNQIPPEEKLRRSSEMQQVIAEERRKRFGYYIDKYLACRVLSPEEQKTIEYAINL